MLWDLVVEGEGGVGMSGLKEGGGKGGRSGLFCFGVMMVEEDSSLSMGCGDGIGRARVGWENWWVVAVMQLMWSIGIEESLISN